jgi:hypothetical protein
MMGKDSKRSYDDDDYYYTADEDDYYYVPVRSSYYGDDYIVESEDDDYYDVIGQDDDGYYYAPVGTGEIYEPYQDDYIAAKGMRGSKMRRRKGQDDYVDYGEGQDDYVFHGEGQDDYVDYYVAEARGKGRDRSRGMMKMGSGYYPASQSPAPIAYASYTPPTGYTMSRGKGKRKSKGRQETLPNTEYSNGYAVDYTYNTGYPDTTMYTHTESGNIFEKSAGMSMREKGRHPNRERQRPPQEQAPPLQSFPEMTVMAQQSGQPEQRQREKERHPRKERRPQPEPEWEKECHPHRDRRNYRPPPVQYVQSMPEMTLMAQQESTQEREQERHPHRDRRYHQAKKHSETTMTQQELQPPMSTSSENIMDNQETRPQPTDVSK